MSENEVHSDEHLAEKTPARNRRSFLKNVLAGLFVAVPAIRNLWRAQPALADPAHRHCASGNTYVTYYGHFCYCGRMIGLYIIFCKICGDQCGSFTDDEGSC
jgi:hypothetical protein